MEGHARGYQRLGAGPALGAGQARLRPSQGHCMSSTCTHNVEAAPGPGDASGIRDWPPTRGASQRSSSLAPGRCCPHARRVPAPLLIAQGPSPGTATARRQASTAAHAARGLGPQCCQDKHSAAGAGARVSPSPGDAAGPGAALRSTHTSRQAAPSPCCWTCGRRPWRRSAAAPAPRLQR